MQSLIAKLAKKTGSQRKPRTSSDQLHLCYGQIGISAVAAAARYQSGAKNPGKNPGKAPAMVKLDPRGAAVS